MNLHPRKQMRSTCPETNKCETSLYSTARNLNLADKQTRGGKKKKPRKVVVFLSALFSQFKGKKDQKFNRKGSASSEASWLRVPRGATCPGQLLRGQDRGQESQAPAENGA